MKKPARVTGSVLHPSHIVAAVPAAGFAAFPHAASLACVVGLRRVYAPVATPVTVDVQRRVNDAMSAATEATGAFKTRSPRGAEPAKAR